MVPLLPPINCVEDSWGWRLHATSAHHHHHHIMIVVVRVALARGIALRPLLLHPH
jgi:hypothetical protein